MSRSASLRVIFGIVALDLIGFGILIPQLGVYGVKYGASPFMAGLLVAVYSLMQLIFAPVLGRLSDRYGRRPVLLLSLAGSALGYLLFAVAHSLPLLFLSRLIDGASGGNIATAQAYVADVTGPEDRAKGMGMVGAAFGIGFVLGPALGGFLGAWGGNLAIGLFAAGLAALNLYCTWRYLLESRPPGVTPPALSAPVRSVRGAVSALSVPVVGRCLVLYLLFTTAFAQMEGTFSVFLLSCFLSGGPVPLEGGLFFLSARATPELLSQASLRTGYIFVVVGVLSALIQGGVLPRLVRRGREAGKAGREAVLATVGLALTAVALAALPWVPSFGWLFPAMGLLAVGSAFINPSLSALVSLAAPPERLGAALGTYQAFGSLGRILGPALGGWLFTRLGPAAPYGTAAAMTAAGAVLALSLVAQVRMTGAGAPQSP
ncbi:MFS transporter [Myxococcaceae bacterium GXIMD 01537]